VQSRQNLGYGNGMGNVSSAAAPLLSLMQFRAELVGFNDSAQLFRWKVGFKSGQQAREIVAPPSGWKSTFAYRRSVIHVELSPAP
jgi:hypothetical protein